MEEKATAPEPRYDMMRVPRALLNKLRIIAAARRRQMAELIEEYAGERVDAEHKAVIEEQTALAPDLGGEAGA